MNGHNFGESGFVYMDEIDRAVVKFNRKFSPEAHARLIGFGENNRIAILFSGAMCLACGMSDYFVDFLEILNKETNNMYVIEDMRELNMDGTSWIVIYAPREIANIEQRKYRGIIIDPKTKEIKEEYL